MNGTSDGLSTGVRINQDCSGTLHGAGLCSRAIALCGEDRGEIGFIPAVHQPLRLDPDLGHDFLSQQGEGEVAQHGEVLGGMLTADPTVVPGKGYVEHPVRPNRRPDALRVGGQSSQVVPRLARDSLTDPAFACNGGNAA